MSEKRRGACAGLTQGTSGEEPIEAVPQKEVSGNSIPFRHQLVWACLWAVVGAIVCTTVRQLVAAPSAGKKSLQDNLLVTQQLDSLFGTLESELKQDARYLESYQKLLDTFLIFDRRYVENASADPASMLARAYAARRMGHCSQIIGNLGDAIGYYRQSRDLFGICMKADPDVIDLFAHWLSIQGQVVYIELQRGNAHVAQDEYRAALHALQQSSHEKDDDYHRSLQLELKSLVQLGVQLRLYAEALDVAERFALSSRVLADKSHEPELDRDLNEANRYLETLSAVLSQQDG